MHEALRGAQRALIAQDEFAQRYFWAQYVMIGDADRALGRS